MQRLKLKLITNFIKNIYSRLTKIFNKIKNELNISSSKSKSWKILKVNKIFCDVSPLNFFLF